MGLGLGLGLGLELGLETVKPAASKRLVYSAAAVLPPACIKGC